jgi:hypothetical protein
MVDKTTLIPTTAITSASGVCTLNKMALVYDPGYFSTLEKTGQQMGLLLGATYDGAVNSPSSNCPASDNFLMSPNWDTSLASISNINLLSSCSMYEIKRTLLSADFRFVN